MLEVVYGKSKNRLAVTQIADKLQAMGVDGTLYIGYPILASADETIFIDALFVSREHGLVVFDMSQEAPLPGDEFWSGIRDKQDSLFFALSNNLGRHGSLRAGRKLAITPNVISILPDIATSPPDLDGLLVATVDSLPTVLSELAPFNQEYERPLNAALQRVTTLKPQKKRSAVQKDDSRGGILKQIEASIANLDRWQKRAAIETPDSPQRIRGLAGSGKTVVLAFKAAYLHTQNPDWKIALTFHTQSLYQQLTELVRRFTYEHANDEPDFKILQIMHAWGSTSKPGVYAKIAEHTDCTVRDFLYAKSKYGTKEAFHGVCVELLNATKDDDVEAIWDAVLIDEAQDLTWPFFQLIYRFTKHPKRIIWVYDELQNLGDHVMPDLGELFGRDADGTELVTLENRPGEPTQDIVLPVCYRNTHWALTLAHALGFGIYRNEGLVQLFDEPSLWDNIGYRVVNGEFVPSQEVVLERKPDSYPEYFLELLDEEDAVICEGFESKEEQARHVATEISRNLKEDELEADDILIILPDPLTAKSEGMLVSTALAQKGITSHIAGVTTSRDEMFSAGSVAISNIYRAKGNEAPMVYVLNCQDCFGGNELIKLRNTLFTAITRSRAWVRLYGWGNQMESLQEEVDQVRKSSYCLRFPVPTSDELARLRMIHRDRSSKEKARIRATKKQLREIVASIESGQMMLEDIPPELREALLKLLNTQQS